MLYAITREEPVAMFRFQKLLLLGFFVFGSGYGFNVQKKPSFELLI